MTLIEGIGDEVTQFFILIAIAAIILIAWWSANVPERPLMRTVLILERRTTRHASYAQTPVVPDVRETNELPSQENEPENIERKTTQSENETTTTNNLVEVNVAENLDNTLVSREEIENIMPNNDSPQTSDADSQNIGEDQLNCSTSNESTLKKRNVKPLQERGEVPCSNECTGNMVDESSSSTTGECEANSTTEGNIRIKLKYLNDDQKLVEGKLQEQLGDFKRRHFNLELSGRKLVRLIFNGKVLQQDSKTLENYGFFDNCVVHCLVHQRRTPPPSPNLNRPTEGQMNNEAPNHQWDLGNILFASLSIALGIAWYGRYQYAQLYTATTTVALIGLTGMFTVSLIGMYVPDVDGIRT